MIALRWTMLFLALPCAACASRGPGGFVERGTTPVVAGGGAAVTEGQMRFESAPIDAGSPGAHIFEFDFQTRVPLESVDFAVLDEQGRRIANARQATVRRIGIETGTSWPANEAVGAPAGSLTTGEIPVGPFHVYLDTVTDRQIVRFVLTFHHRK